MSGTPTELLRELAGPGLYRDNAFAIAGLSAGADRQALRQLRQQVRVARDLGEPGADGKLAALDVIGDPPRRLVHELFAPWAAPDEIGCGCVASLHAAHALAVAAHTSVLSMELDGAREGWRSDVVAITSWSDAAQRWNALLLRDAFWGHVGHRLRALDDRRLGASDVDELRAELPKALVRPVVELAARAEAPARFVAHARQWNAGPDVVDDLLVEAAQILLDKAEGLTVQAAGLLDEGRHEEAAAALTHEVIPLLRRIEHLAPRDRNGRTSTAHDQAAIVLNNIAESSADLSVEAYPQALQWIDTSLRLVGNPEAERAIRANRTGMAEVKQQVHDLRKSVAAALAAGHAENARANLIRIRGDVTGNALVDEVTRLLDEVEAAPSPPGVRRPPDAVVPFVLAITFLVVCLIALVAGVDVPAVIFGVLALAFGARAQILSERGGRR